MEGVETILWFLIGTLILGIGSLIFALAVDWWIRNERER